MLSFIFILFFFFQVPIAMLNITARPECTIAFDAADDNTFIGTGISDFKFDNNITLNTPQSEAKSISAITIYV